MSQTFQPLLGKDVTVTAQPLSIDADGVFSNNGSAFTFVGRLEELTGGRSEATLDPVIPMDCPQDNEVVIGEITRYSLVEIMMALKSSATGVTKGNKLLLLADTCRYFLLTLTAKDHGASPATVYAETARVMWTTFDPNYRRASARGRMELQTHAVFDNTGAYETNPAMVFTA